MKRFLLVLSLFIVSAALLQSCVKKDFDAPPDTSGIDPNLPVNATISRLLQKNNPYNPVGGGPSFLIDTAITIQGIVTANDRSGNFYKQIVIDDNSAGIMVLIDINSLYNDFPVGRKIYIKTQGLYLGYESGLPVLGYTPTSQGGLNAIPANRVDEFIVKANTNNPVPTLTVTLKDVGYTGTFSNSTAYAEYYNRLITISEAQFEDPTKNYTEPNASASRDIVSCDDYRVTVRSSNYANFAGNKLPAGKGSITGIYTVYTSSSGRKTPQLLLRDSTDVHFDSARCAGTAVETVILSEGFDGGTSGEIQLTGWTNFAQTGGIKYVYSNAGSTSNPYAKITAFTSGQASVISWLVTPGFDLTGAQNPKLTFKSSNGFSNGAESFQVMISTNYTEGTDPNTATWTPLQATFPAPKSSGYTPFTASDDVDLSSYSGTAHIAWKYTGGDPGKTGTWELDEVKVTKD